MHVWTDKQGNRLTMKEFFSRWKQGILSIDQYQQTKLQIRSTWVVVIGLILGVGVAIYYRKSLWWLSIVLLGALGNTLVQLIALYQKKKALKQFQDMLKFTTEVKNGY